MIAGDSPGETCSEPLNEQTCGALYRDFGSGEILWISLGWCIIYIYIIIIINIIIIIFIVVTIIIIVIIIFIKITLICIILVIII
jgi:hypothetical protein